MEEEDSYRCMNKKAFKELANRTQAKFIDQINNLYITQRLISDLVELVPINNKRSFITPSISQNVELNKEYGEMYKEYQDIGIYSEGFLFSNSCFIAIENTFKYIDRKYIINALKCSKKSEIQKFQNAGILRVINTWINEYKTSFPQFATEMLELITKFPINRIVIRNHSNEINKIINELSKDTKIPYLQKQALICKEKWKEMLHEEREKIESKNKSLENHSTQHKQSNSDEKDDVQVKRQRETTTIDNNNNQQQSTKPPSPKKAKTITVNNIIIDSKQEDKKMLRQKSMKQTMDALRQQQQIEEQQKQKQQLNVQMNGLHSNKIVSYKGNKNDNLSLSDLENKIKTTATAVVYEDKLNSISPTNNKPSNQQQPVKKIVNDVFGNVLRKSKENLEEETIKHNVINKTVVNAALPKLFAPVIQVKTPEKTNKRHIQWSEKLVDERIFISEEESHTTGESMNDLRKKEQETEGHVLQTEKPKIPFVTPPLLAKPLFELPMESTFESRAEDARCSNALYSIKYETNPFEYKTCKTVNVTSSIQSIPVHPILAESAEEGLLKLFNNHKDLMIRIKKCNLVLPDDDYIPPVFKNHKVENNMFLRLCGRVGVDAS